MQVQLIVQSGAKPSKFVLRLPTVLGRSQAADVKVNHHHVSRRHCEIFADGVELVLRDLGSANGTLVNGQRMDGEVSLASGDEISLGGVVFCVQFRRTPARDIPVPRETVTAREDPPSESAAVDLGCDDSSAFVHYDETEEGSFIGIRLDDPPPEFVSGKIDLGQRHTVANDVSRIDLTLDVKPDEPADDDSALDEFLRNLPQ